jgi:Tol biopolymer transport system component/DNA-binding winged helix-turn-helix (wHTH) protein
MHCFLAYRICSSVAFEVLKLVTMNAIPQLIGRRPSREQLAQPNLRLLIGTETIDVGALRVISRPQTPRLTSKAVGVLLELVRDAGNTVTRDQLLETVWKDRVTTPDVLTQAIKELRRALEGDGKQPGYIETVPKVGYRLLAPVSVLSAADTSLISDSRIRPDAQNDTFAPANTHETVESLGSVAGGWAPQPSSLKINPAHESPRSSTLKWITLCIGAAAVVIAAVALIPHSVHRTDNGAQWVASNIRTITSDPGSEMRPHISPDGTRVAFGKLSPDKDSDAVYVRALEPSQLVGLTPHTQAAHDENPVWSPDGSHIVFDRLGKDHCALFVVSSLGGSEREIGDCQNFIWAYYDWTPDGKQLIADQQIDTNKPDLALVRWDIASGIKTPLSYARSPGDEDLEPRYSPDGHWLAFRRGIAPYSDLFLIANDGTGETRQLTRLSMHVFGYSWTADSSTLVFASDYQGRSELYTASIDEGIVRKVGVAPAKFPDAARNGNTVVYEIPRITSTLTEVSIDALANPSRTLTVSTGSESAPAFSPDNKSVAFVSDRSGTMQIWIYDRATSAVSPLTDYRDATLFNPTFRRDGKALLVGVHQGRRQHLVEIELETRREHDIGKAGEDILFGSYGPATNSFLLFTGTSPNSGKLVYRRNLGGSDVSQVALATGVQHAEIDPTRLVVYYTKIGGTGLFRRSLDGGAEEFVTDKVNAATMDGWRVVDGNIWYLVQKADKTSPIHEFDAVTKRDRTVATVDGYFDDVNFAVNTEHNRIILAPIRSDDTDVGAFELLRTQTTSASH